MPAGIKKLLYTKAHEAWLEVIRPGSLLIDATLGNGHDTLFLAQALQKGQIVGYDIQEAAISSTLNRLQSHDFQVSNEGDLQITLKLQSHAHIAEKNARLIVYNLGYLPCHDKSVTTMTETTLKSLESAKSALMPGGLLSITCYPGHLEGEREAAAVMAWAEKQTAPWSMEVIPSPSPFLILLRLSA